MRGDAIVVVGIKNSRGVITPTGTWDPFGRAGVNAGPAREMPGPEGPAGAAAPPAAPD